MLKLFYKLIIIFNDDTKKEYRIENLILDENQIIKVAKQTKTMPMLKFSPVKFSLKDIKNFLSY